MPDRTSSMLAAEVGIGCTVILSPEVWAACASAINVTDPEMIQTAQAQAARKVFASLARCVKRMQDGRVLFACRLPRRLLYLVAETQGDSQEPVISVRLAGK